MTASETPQHLVAMWNENYPPGTKVRIINEAGVATETETTSPAMIFAHREAVIWIKGVAGHIDLNRLVVI